MEKGKRGKRGYRKERRKGRRGKEEGQGSIEGERLKHVVM